MGGVNAVQPGRMGVDDGIEDGGGWNHLVNQWK